MFNAIGNFMCDTGIPILLGGITLALVGFVLFMGYQGVLYFLYERRFDKQPTFKIKAKLLRAVHNGSTLETHAVPVVTGNGVGMGVTTTGHDEEFTTIWDCGKYGRLVSDDEVVFQYAKKNSTLYLKKLGNDIRIDGIDA